MLKELNQDLPDRNSATYRDEMIIKYAPIVKHVALRILVKLPSHIEFDDLMSAGVIGLIDAVEKYDETKETKFSTYAEIRIRGAILDELRALDWVPRTVRQKATKMAKAYTELEQELGCSASDEQVAEHLGVEMEEFYQMLQAMSGIPIVSIDGIVGREGSGAVQTIADTVAGPSATEPHVVAIRNEIRDIIAKAIDELPEKERLLVSLYYYEELNMKEIGAVMGVTESRVSQIHTKAVLRLKGKIEKTLNSQGNDV